MFTVVSKALEEHSTSAVNSVSLSMTNGVIVDMSAVSISCSNVKEGAGFNLVEIGLSNKQSEQLHGNESIEKVADVDQSDSVKPAPRSLVTAAGMELSVQTNDDSEEITQLSSDADDVEQPAMQISVSAGIDSGHRSWILKDLPKGMVCLVKDYKIVKVDEVAVSDDMTVFVSKDDDSCHNDMSAGSVYIVKDIVGVDRNGVTSLSSPKWNKKSRNITGKYEASSQAASLMSLRPDKPLNVTVSSSAVDDTATQSSLRSSRHCSRRSETGSTVASEASEVVIRPGASHSVSSDVMDNTASATVLSIRTPHIVTACQPCRSQVDSQAASVVSCEYGTKATSLTSSHARPAVRPSVSYDVSSSNCSLDSDMSANSPSVVVSKPPIHFGPGNKTSQPAAEAKTSKTTGNSVSLVFRF